MAVDPLDRIAKICHDQPPDALTQIAAALGFHEPHTHSDYADGFDAGKEQAFEQLLNFLRHAQKNPDRGDEVFRCGFNGALDVVAARIREMQAAAAGVDLPVGGGDGR